MCQTRSLGFVAATLSTVSSGATALSNLVFDLLSFVAVLLLFLAVCRTWWYLWWYPAAAQQEPVVLCLAQWRSKFSGSLEPRAPVCILY